jgi:hypothetical protein
MAIIPVPKPPRSAWDPNRAVSTLLKSQVEHLYEAERKLPLKYKSQIYINTITTEGEAAEYIQKVTTAIHRAHEDAAARRVKSPRRRSTIAIAAVAGKPRAAKSAKKTKAGKSKPPAKTPSKKSKSAAAKTGRKK